MAGVVTLRALLIRVPATKRDKFLQKNPMFTLDLRKATPICHWKFEKIAFAPAALKGREHAFEHQKPICRDGHDRCRPA
jgi:hypothetical protein